MESMLGELGCAVFATASTSDRALAIIKASTRKFDVAILDLNLDGESADDVARALETRGIPYIVTTG